MMKTMELKMDIMMILQVSIPHRYDENLGDFNIIPRSFWWFQSLIGMMKTVFAVLPFADLQVVSIPHRYDENYLYFSNRGNVYGVSIPHRYDENDTI